MKFNVNHLGMIGVAGILYYLSGSFLPVIALGAFVLVYYLP